MSIITNWQFHQLTPLGNWFPCTNTTYGNQVHLDLLYNNLIPYPFENDNEKELEWIKEVDWEYKVLFNSITTESLLIFEGLDTFATVIFNNETILNSNNAFHKHIINVTTRTENELRIIFNSSFNIGKDLEMKYGKKPVWNGDSSRVYVRKPQYQFGWDWQLSNFNTVGPWRPVKLVQDSYVDDIFVKYDLNENLTIAYLNIEISAFKLDKFDFLINDKVVSSKLKFNYTLEDIKLWYPKQIGDPYLYKFEIISNGEILKSIKFGFRKVELKEFYFEINNVPIQIHGVNWIPLNSFSSNVTIQDYYKMINLIDFANVNLIRVWGGGIYEIDEFYQKCDELGMLVWQDFMFACGIYPNLPNIEKEIDDQVKRLSKYSSIIIYAGNNEDYQLANLLNIDTNNITQFPGKIIYEKIIPKKIRNAVYRFESPYSNNSTLANDESIGDTHQWKVWLNQMGPYQNWMKLSAKFISEFGMFSFPSYKTLSKYITSDLFPYSEMINSHSQADQYQTRLNHYLSMNFNKSETNLTQFIYLTQLLQSDALSLAYRYWRFKWVDYQVGGMIVWQLNDCWPGLSRSIIDFEKTPKLAYYGIKRELADNVIGIYRNQDKIESILKPDIISIWVISKETNLTLIVEYYHLNGELYKRETFKDTLIHDRSIFENSIIHTKLIKGTKIIARSSDWPLLKYTNINPTLSITYNGSFLVSTDKPIKGLELTFENNYIFSDNGIDLFPNDPQIINIPNFNVSDLKSLKYNYYSLY